MGFGIREFGSAMRGVGDAAVYHEEAQRRRAEEEFRKQQRIRQQQEWSDEDEARARLAAVSETEEGYAPEYGIKPGTFPTKDDEGNTQPGVTSVKRADHAVMGDRAKAYLASKSPKLQGYGMQMDQQARALRDDATAQTELAARKAVLAKYAPEIDKIRTDPMGWLAVRGGQLYGQIPDGHYATTQSMNGKIRINLHNEKTNEIAARHDISEADAQARAFDIVKQMMRVELGAVSPQDFIAGLTMDNQTTVANAAMKNALVNQGELGIKQALLPGQQSLQTAHAGYYNRMPQPQQGHAPNWNIVGADEAGIPIEHDRTSGQYRRGGVPITGAEVAKLLPKVTGIRPTPEVDPTRRKAAETAMADAVLSDDKAGIKRLRAAYPDVFGEDKAKKETIDALKKYNPEDKGGKKAAPSAGKSEPAPEKKGVLRDSGKVPATSVLQGPGTYPTGKPLSERKPGEKLPPATIEYRR